MAKNKNQLRKIPSWAWAVSGLLVGLAAAWIAVESVNTANQPANNGQSNNVPSVAQNTPSGAAAPQPQVNAGGERTAHAGAGSIRPPRSGQHLGHQRGRH